ncbi:PREDICTED: probably inactive receptor-like protein kinase At5g41680 [Tarenaya hassleriana]|uniref:probably inactive receptor-like protein kinase At5g41680 n=1 Tax=Tarenaya hassleriana TaxID=28532 RepID=UPI00053C3899|nr:PREDICTED: probably inactive receptor-like protein kinase At5g41680 [Tarenaya hassleriana]XP_010553545.1 PREDICTED: probably inactive receptor-like protein kinase At5g41680 [Tarenaya hassleriana]XP_019059274.1 PREDICTED: probably inactive receptor-like protein kinase At5g41680 [Tarenaya hassleriana]
MEITCCLRTRRRSNTRGAGKSQKGSSSSMERWASGEEEAENSKIVFFGGSNCHAFRLDDLLRASAEVMGKGSFSTSYKAVLDDITTVVVKRLKEETVAVGVGEFEQQMKMVGAIRHENVTELKAYYYSKANKLVVYGYHNQGSLSEILHGGRGEKREPLDWDGRLRMAIGAARGLAHIHESNNGKLVHGNIKSSNVFTNSKNYGCIGDIGLTPVVKSLPQSVTRSSGYHAPETIDTRKSTQISDVYSFGVVLLEILTGKSPASKGARGENMHLASWIRSVVLNEWTGEVFDMELMRHSNGGGVEEEMVEMLQIGLACVDVKPEERPMMRDVLRMMEDIRPLLDDDVDA